MTKVFLISSLEKYFLGSDRETVRKDNGNFKEFKKSKFSKNTTDDFSSFHVYYNTENKVIAVEFFREANLCFSDTPIFSKSYSEIKTLMKDSDVVEDDSSIIFKTLGFSIYAPDKNEIESVMVFEKGYYD